MDLFLQTVNTLAIVVGIIIAWRGLNTWKKQLRGESDYAIARRYLGAVYKIRNTIRGVRNPAIFLGEFASALQKVYPATSLEKATEKEKNFAVYSLRWEKINEAQAELDVGLLDAEVLWSKKATEILKDLYNVRTKLYINLKRFLDGDPTTDETVDNVIYGKDGDEFNKEMDAAVKVIEDFLRDYLR